jgi:hypothetical protein
MPLPHSARRVVAVAATLTLALASLAGCGVAEEAKKTMDALDLDHMGSFETATRTPVADATDGRTFLVRVKSRRKAHWYEAMSATSADLGSYCADGVPFSLLRMTPAHDPRANKPGEYTWHPAGTVFEQEISCSDPFEGQRVVPAGTGAMAALEALKGELVAGGQYDRNRHLYTRSPFNDRHLKYRAVTETIGSMVMGVNGRCRGGGVQVKRLLVHANPTPDPAEGVFLNGGDAFVGIDAICADGLPADDRL